MRIRVSERTQKKVPKVNIERVACNLKRRTYHTGVIYNKQIYHQIGKYVPPNYSILIIMIYHTHTHTMEQKKTGLLDPHPLL